MCYDSKKKCYWPSDLKFGMFTFTIIFIPAGICFACPIWGSDPEEIELEVKIILSILEGLFLFMSLWNLFFCAFTDPGVIPAMHMNSGIPTTKYCNRSLPDVKKDYYCEYKNKAELDETMDFIGLDEPVEKFYNANKFKYLELVHNVDGDIGTVPKNK